MITADHIYKSFGEQQVLKDISLTFEEGKVNMIIGASGSGKTVLLKAISGLHGIDSGTIRYDQTCINVLDEMEKKAIRRQTGMLFQGAALFDFATASENVRFPLDFFTDWSAAQKKERVEYCLERVKLTNIHDKYPSELSGGMQKRVGIARALVMNPKYLFCDEPNSGLDPQTSIKIDELLSGLTHEFNITTVINTHDMNSVVGIGEKIVFIYEGCNLWTGTKNDIFMSDCKELNDFVFASQMAQLLKETKS